MAIKICATNNLVFNEIECSLNVIGKEFANKFNTAEYIVEGLSDLTLTVNQYLGKAIRLPNGFIMTKVRIEEDKQFETATTMDAKATYPDTIVKTRIRYEIEGTYGGKYYHLVYKGLNDMIPIEVAVGGGEV